MLVTPLMREGTAIGAISIRRTEVRPFSGKQIGLLKTFADQAVIAIEKSGQDRVPVTTEREIVLRPDIRNVGRADVQPVLDAIVESSCA
jgi:GAF domain-containing protein